MAVALWPAGVTGVRLLADQGLVGEHVARVLRATRSEQGMTQLQVATRLGMTVDGYRPYERGVRQLRTHHIPKFAHALGLSAAELAHRLGLRDEPGVPESDALRHAARATVGAVSGDELAELVADLVLLQPSERVLPLRAARLIAGGMLRARQN